LNSSPFMQWLTSMYFVLTVFTTVGFGDISAVTEVEIICVTLIMLAGCVVHSIIISRVIQAVTSTDRIHEFINKQLKMVDAFSEHTGLAPAVQKRLKGEIAWRAQSWAVHRSYDKAEITQLITSRYVPCSIVEEMPVSLFSGKLLRNRFLECCCCLGFSRLPPRFPLLLAVHLARVHFAAGEIVYHMHDFPFNIFLVLSGTFACVARPTLHGGIDDICKIEENGSVDKSSIGSQILHEIAGFRGSFVGGVGSSAHNHRTSELVEAQHSSLYPYRLFSHCNYFGEGEILQGRPRMATVRCEREGTLLVLAKQDLLYLEEQFPQFRSGWHHAAPIRERFRREACRRLTLPLPVRHFAAVGIQRYFRWRRRHKQLRNVGNSDANHTLAENAFVQLVEDNSKRASLNREKRGATSGDEDMYHKVDSSNGELHRKVDSLSASLSALRNELLPKVDFLSASVQVFHNELIPLLRRRERSRDASGVRSL